MDIKLFNECVDCVGEINDEIDEIFGGDFEEGCLTVETDGDEIWVSFIGNQIWYSGEDTRNYINENTPEEDYEPLKLFLKKQIMYLVNMISKISFKEKVEGKDIVEVLHKLGPDAVLNNLPDQVELKDKSCFGDNASINFIKGGEIK